MRLDSVPSWVLPAPVRHVPAGRPRRVPFAALLAVLALLAPGSGSAQAAAAGEQFRIPKKPNLDKVVKRAEQIRELQITDDEERQLGADVSARVRDRYGVVQNEAVHRYVTLVGTLLARKSERPGLRFTFVVLDTDGVNAFAAPGGFIHITRGALGLMTTEAELAGVLAHEIIHVTEKHTIRAIQKNKAIQMTAEESIKSNAALWNKLVDVTSDMVLAGFGRGEELESDEQGLVVANSAGYSPEGLGGFLKRLEARNRNSSGKQGLFASHPEMKERLDKIERRISSQRLASSAVLGDRYKASIPFGAAAVTEIAAVEDGAAGLAGRSGSKASTDAEPKKKGFSLSALTKPGGSEKKSAEVIGSGASRGVDAERNAKGGPVKTLVSVKITPAELEAFRKQGNLLP